MKKIEVIIKDKKTLELLEDASKGDIIDLEEINNIDYTNIQMIIEKGKDDVYNKRFDEYKKNLDKQKENEIKVLEENNKKNLELKILEISSKHNEEIQKLKNINLLNINDKDIEINKLKQELNSQKELLESIIEKEKLKIKQENIEAINLLKEEINKKTREYEEKLNNKNLEHLKEIGSVKEELGKIIREKEDTINLLQRQKASLNVKQTGEDLESWCNNEMISYMQNGFINCTWQKDNTVIKELDENKGSKADFIFKVFVDDKHKEEDLLTSVCLEMKDENPDSISKKTNADYYKQLDKNRNKKGCKYALLVSNLETEKANDIPIYRVNEYQDMYVVRPAYMMTFLNIITSLTMRFVKIILDDKNETLELKKKNDFFEEFEKVKLTYLDKPLETLTKEIEAIRKNNESIIKAANGIDEICSKISRSYINIIEDKINKFEDAIVKNYRRLEK